MELNEPRARSFRYEDYGNRRVFLRSYPLDWGEEKEKEEEEEEEEENKEDTVKATDKDKGDGEKNKPMKKIILSVIHWGEGKIVILRRVKHKIVVYVINCLPVGFKLPTVKFKAPTALISA